MPHETRGRAGAYAWYVLAILSLIYIVNFLDRQILSILAEDIKADLQLDDAQLGFLYGTAFAIFYALFGVPLGRMADIWFRGRLIALGLVLWSSMTSLSGLATSFTGLAAARMMVGIGEASASPAALSLLADYFPPRQRALVASIYSAGAYIGAGISLPLGGWIAGEWDRMHLHISAPFDLRGWQVAFLVLGVPGLLLALWMLKIREPDRGAAEGLSAPVARPDAWRVFGRELLAIIPPFTLLSAAREPGELRRNFVVTCIIAAGAWALCRMTGDIAQWTVFGIGLHSVYSWTRTLRQTDYPTWSLTCGTPTVMLTILATGLTVFVINTFSFWVAPLALREFGVSKELIGVWIGLPGAAMSIIGVVCGGWLSDRWKARDPRGRVFVMMLAISLPAPFMVAMYLAPNFEVFRTIAPIAYLLSALWAGSAITLMQDFVLPRMRGTAASAFFLGATLIGLALGPYVTGKLAAVTGSLRVALLLNLLSIPVTLFVLFIVSRQAGACEANKSARARLAGELC
jgi:MFS family permease